MRITFTLFLFLSFSLSALSQDFEYGKPSNAEWEMKKYDKDSSAHAVVLREYGLAKISVAESLPVIFEYHVRIKILDNKGFDSGNVTVSLYHNDKQDHETIRFIQGLTIYKDGDGKIKKSVLDNDLVQRKKANEHYDDVTFNLPNLSTGCIIEYSYQTESPFHDKFHTWNFQSDIPKIHSEFVANTPAIVQYKIALRGPLKLTSKTQTVEPQSFKFYDLTADCVNISYTMDDIPAFIEEEYMTAASNYRSALYFELLAEANDDNFVQKITKEWKDVDYTLKYHENFGGQITHTSYIKKQLPTDIWSISDTLTKAKAIYAYLQKTLKWNNFIAIYSLNGIEKAFDDKRGTCGDINLALVTALNAAGINTEAVILSTRDHGNINKLYPVLNNFNYVIAKANIGGQSYLLDATDPLLSFGLLPLRCINDVGRVISLDKPSYWINMVQAQKRNIASTVSLALQTDGKIKGTITSYSLGYSAYEKRLAIKRLHSTQTYVDSLAKEFSIMRILKYDIQGIDSLELPITETYEIEIDPINPYNDGAIAFDPAFWARFITNPFKLTGRNYPVDMGSESKNALSVILLYPDNYVVMAQPAMLSTSMPDNGGAYISNVTVDPGIIKYSQIEKLNKAIYQPNEYLYLKEFYNKIIQSQKAYIIFKKKS